MKEPVSSEFEDGSKVSSLVSEVESVLCPGQRVIMDTPLKSKSLEFYITIKGFNG